MKNFFKDVLLFLLLLSLLTIVFTSISQNKNEEVIEDKISLFEDEIKNSTILENGKIENENQKPELNFFSKIITKIGLFFSFLINLIIKFLMNLIKIFLG